MRGTQEIRMYYKPIEGPLASTAFGSHEGRVAAERASEERAALRQSRIERQSSPQLSILERVEHWERFHGVRLPVNPKHPLLRVIAADTALALEDIHAEQARRKVGTVSA
jgi:hypothetical protein